MKKFLALFFLTVAGLLAQEQKIDLGSRGKLTLYAPDGWKFDIADYGDRQLVTIAPRDEKVNASCSLTITFPEQDRLDTKKRLALRAEINGEPFAGQSVEGRSIAKEFSLQSGFGYYCNFTDPDLVGKPPQPGNFKTMSVGLIHLRADVLIEVTISADGFSSNPYQELLGMIEGMEYSPGKRK